MSESIVFAAAESGGLAEMARHTGEQFGFNLGLFFSQLISFVIVAFLLNRFAYKPILRVLEQRRQGIADSVAEAAKIKQEIAKTEAARQHVLAEANAQANKLIAEAREAAGRVQEVETKRATAAAEQIISKAHEAAEVDHQRMLQGLRKEVGRLVVQTTAKVSGKVLTAEDQKRLVDEANRELAI